MILLSLEGTLYDKKIVFQQLENTKREIAQKPKNCRNEAELGRQKPNIKSWKLNLVPDIKSYAETFNEWNIRRQIIKPREGKGEAQPKPPNAN